MPPELQDVQRDREVQRARAQRLEEQIGVLEQRLAELEQTRAADAGRVAALTHELGALRSEQELITARITLPLRRLEQALRWLAEKAGKVGGLIGRHLLFRRGRKG